jgi:hypothetical protein
VGLYSGCDSDATYLRCPFNNKTVAMEKRYYCEINAFLSHRYYSFYSVLPSDFDNIFFTISDDNYSATDPPMIHIHSLL